jgi:LCP family protein required for cell wall assembly
MPRFKQHSAKTKTKRSTTTSKKTTGPIVSALASVDSPKKTFRYSRELSKTVLWVLLTLSAFALMLAGYTVAQVRQFEQISGVSAISLAKSAYEARKTNLFSEKNDLTLLILGLDSTQGRDAEMIMTDTIMLARIKSDGTILLLPLPRDLWIDSLKTKINALYHYGQESQGTTGHELLEKIIADITGISVDHHIIIDIDHLEEIINAVGGVDVMVERSFTDEKYPAEVSLDPSQDQALYQTIAFSQGDNHFNGEQALKFMRSRQSEDLIEGTDQARSKRQQKVIEALVHKLSRDKSIMTPDSLGKLLSLWNQIETNMDMKTIFAIGLHSLQTPPTFSALSIPIANADNAGIITNPPIAKHNQWVWEPIDPSWNEFKQWVAQHY